MYALERFGISVAERSSLYRFIGPPLVDSFMEFYGFTDADARLAVSYYREYYADKGLFENTPYPGIAEVLARLRSITRRKCQNLRRACNAWRRINKWAGACRFDVIEIYGVPEGGKPVIDHIPNVRLFAKPERFVNWN